MNIEEIAIKILEDLSKSHTFYYEGRKSNRYNFTFDERPLIEIFKGMDILKTLKECDSLQKLSENKNRILTITMRAKENDEILGYLKFNPKNKPIIKFFINEKNNEGTLIYDGETKFY